MTRYKNINELDARIERIISKTVKAYYTDWKNIDRVKYMRLKGSDRKEDKQMILIARTCGTYLYTLEELKGYPWAGTVYEYYQNTDRATYYRVNLDRLTIEKIDPTTYKIA